MYVGQVLEFNYTGEVESFELLPGVYKLECYGAQGGDATGGYIGGYGGYHCGTITIVDVPKTIYLCVGSKGGCTNNQYIMAPGGYNGGGNGKYNNSGPQYVGAGGGASSITLTNRGILSNFNSYRSEVLLVAGGGGGADWWTGRQAANGGGGGGLTGSTGKNTIHTPGTGGTQTAGGGGGASGSFGQGAFGSWIGVGSAGGGGGWYGGGASYDNAGGGGGSGYANDSYLTDISYANDQRQGDGMIKITCIITSWKCKVQVVNQEGIHGFVNGQESIDVMCGEELNFSVSDNFVKSKFLLWKDDDMTYGKYQENLTIMAKAEWKDTIHKMYCCCIPIPKRRNEDFYKDNHDQYVYDADRLKRVIGV